MEITKQSVERSGNLNPMFGKRHTQETKKKISDSQKMRYQTIRKAIREQDILQFETNGETRKEFIHQLLEKNNISFDTIQQAVNFVAFLTEKERVKDIIREEINKLLAKD